MLFTKDFGMLGVVAQGVRLSKSKLKYHIQDFSFSKVSLVRGKEVWRLTGASEIENIIKPGILHIKILKLLKRLLIGEESNRKLFDIVECIYRNNCDDSDAMEYLTVLRILNELGYVRNTESINKYLINHEINDEILVGINNDKQNIINLINNGLHQSQL
jgi:recombinational DNA repair protein (RecF pathway)